MKNLKLFAIIILILGGTAFAGWKFYSSYYFFVTTEFVTVEFKYLEYACGGCDPPWNVQEVLSNKTLTKRFYNTDMEVDYQGKMLEDVLKNENWSCILCSKFEMTGKIKSTLSKKYKFIAETYRLIKNKTCCEE